MDNIAVNAEGQITLPNTLRRRLGIETGAELEVSEEADGLRLRIIRTRACADVARLAGLVTAPSKGAPRSLEDFDPASFLTRERGKGT
jgi:AbrB family looped-hinge helix DNA binding protein